ncbi:MAG: hypothetical protein IT372_13790 [Polyangiaceae bacterium]|nr:hypothetical protein [Polyangiaceae bacterium]
MMRDDDPLLDALGTAARRDDPLGDPAWDALSAGALSEADQAALRRRAVAAGLPDDVLDAFRPLDAAAEERIAARALDALGAEGAEAGEARKVDVGRGGRLPARRRAIGAVASALALAAGVALLLRLGGPDPVPDYGIAIAGGDSAVRQQTDPPEGIPRFGPGARVEVTLRPRAPVRGPVEARAFLVREGRAQPWRPPIEVAEGGAVRVAGTKEALFAGIPDGRWEIAIAVGRPGALPDEAAVATRAAGEGFRLLRREILLGAAGGAP